MNLANVNSTESEFEEKETNDIVVRSYISIGSLQGFGKIEVEARESVIPDRRHSAYFVKIGLESSNEYTQSSDTLIGYDDIDKLIKAIERLETVLIKTDRFPFTEVEFAIDDLKIIVSIMKKEN